MKTTRRFHVYLRPEPDSGYTAIVPALPGCVTYGRNITEARTMADDAIHAYIASLKKHGEPIPSGADQPIEARPQRRYRFLGRRLPLR